MSTISRDAVECRQASYAVSWRGADGRVARGSLRLEGSRLVLRGSGRGGVLVHEAVALADVASVRIGRADAERVAGERSVVLELRGGAVLAVAPLGAGEVFELAELVAELRSEDALRSERVVVVLPLRRGTAERARELVASGPPFDLDEADLDRHEVFVSEREAVFVFEGANAGETLERLVRDPEVLRQAARWRACLAGRPRLAEASYAWRRGA